MRQEILNYVVLPVIDGAVPFNLVSFEFYVLDVHAGIIGEIPEGHLYKLLSKQVVLLGNVRVVEQVLHRLLTAHGCSGHVRQVCTEIMSVVTFKLELVFRRTILRLVYGYRFRPLLFFNEVIVDLGSRGGNRR